ncbi:hypothetical protein [uncultured Litoreibacter sp.]|uniref:hypothetical protein n=1 Tax=uncultured Litoreibacter sp. TaxID=1392394 RepID=UPI00260D63CC|nr:hypothetical protein [uncultured Litoreibacter sp.]
MTRYIFTILAAFLTLPVAAQAQTADVTCDDSARLERMLTTVMQSERRALGLRGPETVLEVWIDPRTQDWTLVQTYTNGTSCIIAMGEHWEELTPAPA